MDEPQTDVIAEINGERAFERPQPGKAGFALDDICLIWQCSSTDLIDIIQDQNIDMIPKASIAPSVARTSKGFLPIALSFGRNPQIYRRDVDAEGSGNDDHSIWESSHDVGMAMHLTMAWIVRQSSRKSLRRSTGTRPALLHSCVVRIRGSPFIVV